MLAVKQATSLIPIVFAGAGDPIGTGLVASLATACGASRFPEQKEAVERKEMGQQLTAAYYSCVRTSFASQRPTMVDRNMGIDQAFRVCQTEESKLQAFENALSENPNLSNAAIATHRNALKEELLRR